MLPPTLTALESMLYAKGAVRKGCIGVAATGHGMGSECEDRHQTPGPPCRVGVMGLLRLSGIRRAEFREVSTHPSIPFAQTIHFKSSNFGMIASQPFFTVSMHKLEVLENLRIKI